MAKVPTNLLALLGLLLVGLMPGSASAQPTTYSPEDYVVGAWWLYKSVFVEDGRVIDRSNGNISHSEGQGYGMLLAVAADDRSTFDAMLNWTQRALYVRGDHLAAWKWDPDSNPHVSDTNNASDGDLLIAWALVRAAKKWNEPGFIDIVKQILHDLGQESIIVDPRYGTLLLPAATGFAAGQQVDGPVVNPSYWVFPAIEELSSISPDFPAQALIESGRRLMATARFGSSQLPADWISLKEAYPRPAAKFAPNFSYDAVREPLYAAWHGPDSSKLLSKVYERWNIGKRNTVQVIELATGAPLVAMSDPGYEAVSELLTCSLGKTADSQVMTAFVPTEYYPSTLHLMSIVAMSERYPQCLQNLN